MKNEELEKTIEKLKISKVEKILFQTLTANAPINKDLKDRNGRK